MPFKSEKQMKWMYANKPAMAKRWAKETPNIKRLPNKASTKKVTEALKRKFVK